MRRARLLSLLFAAALAVAPASKLLAAEEQSLLTSDGTLHVLTSGRAVDLGVDGVNPQANLIQWTSLAQDGTLSMQVLPGTVSSDEARELQLAYDEQTQILLLLWMDSNTFSQVHISVLRPGGSWTTSLLLPTQGISQASNARMTITHKPVFYHDAHGQLVFKTASILAITWWEEALIGQARLATVFLDEHDFDPASMTVYDLPTLSGGAGGAVSYDGIPTGAYLFPAVQTDGLQGSVLASFADLHDQRHRILRIDFPTDYGTPSDPNDTTWKRRHIPIVGVALDGPIARMAPYAADTVDGVRTLIGRGYRPTMSWSDGVSLKYTRLDTDDWAPVRTITIDTTMTYDKAMALVTSMAERN
jgi:hypothetical protein